MIVQNNTTPEKNLYYLGAVILAIFQEKKIIAIELSELYTSVKNRLNISFNLFLLALNWLYLLDSINIKNNDNRQLVCLLKN